MSEGFRLDLTNTCLWYGSSEIPLTPKAFAVVQYLIDHAGQVVSKATLLDSLWPNEDVSEAALTSTIRDLRRALNDSSKKPSYIETLHRRGYRWIGGPVSILKTQSAPQSHFPLTPDFLFVGRSTELSQLHHYWQLASAGQRQLIFLTGESGIGKTSLLTTFLSQIADDKNVYVGMGQCVEQYGSGEAYRPVLEALGRLCRASAGHQIVELLEYYAPSWLIQMPSVLTPEQQVRLQQRGIAPKKRWLRELAEALEAITTHRLLLLVLEDLHWGDPSTIELLEVLARRQEPARLMMLASYRPIEVLGSKHPLRYAKPELQLHHHCREVSLDYLSEIDVVTYLRRRCPVQFSEIDKNLAVSGMATAIYQRTSGNPLFLVNVVDCLLEDRDWLNHDGQVRREPQQLLARILPENLQQLIEAQFDALSPEQRHILEAASVEGMQFVSTTVATCLGISHEQIEACLEDLVRRNHFVTFEEVIILPDDEVGTRYRFIHALYQEGLYQRLAMGRRVRLHRTLGSYLETLYGDQSQSIAAQLALHFERGMDYLAAIRYRHQAAENALQRNAHREASEHCYQGLALLTTVSNPVEQARLELKLQTLLGSALMTLKGQGAPEVGQVYARARDLCQQLKDSTKQFMVILGLWRYYFMRANLPTALDLGQHCLTLAEQTQESEQLVGAHYALAGTLQWMGTFEAAHTHAEAAITHYCPQSHGSSAFRHAQDPGATAMGYRALNFWYLGYPDQALGAMHQMLALDIVQAHAPTQAAGLVYASMLYGFLRDAHHCQQQAEAASSFAEQWQVPQYASLAAFYRGYACSLRGQGEVGLPMMLQALADRRSAGIDLCVSLMLILMAEAHMAMGQFKLGLVALSQAEAAMEQSNERFLEAEYYRLKGELVLLNTNWHNEKEAEQWFQRSLEVARQQQAKSFELRAATSLARLWQYRGNFQAAQALLLPIYESFSEGFNTPDLETAQRFLGLDL